MKAAPWVLVAGGFHRSGGMDRANLALAEFLLDQKIPVHVVTHSVSDPLPQHPLVTVHLVARPLNSFILGEFKLDLQGRSIARAMVKQDPRTRVVVNGGNCLWTDVNWVHCVHHAWPCVDDGAPAWFRAKNRAVKIRSIRREAKVLRAARVVVANSPKTKKDLVELVGIPAARIHTVSLGGETGTCPPTSDERTQARRRFPSLGERPLVAFVGALSHDRNKGFDTLWSAWMQLCGDPSWDGHLVVAGGGSGVAGWEAATKRSPFRDRVEFLGFTKDVPEILKAADLLVSPVRYEAYGLNVHEAVSLGVPSFVASQAGVAEQFPQELRQFLLPDPVDAATLAARIRIWHAGRKEWRQSFRSFGNRLAEYTWRDMAQKFFEHSTSAVPASSILFEESN